MQRAIKKVLPLGIHTLLDLFFFLPSHTTPEHQTTENIVPVQASQSKSVPCLFSVQHQPDSYKAQKQHHQRNLDPRIG